MRLKLSERRSGDVSGGDTSSGRDAQTYNIGGNEEGTRMFRGICTEKIATFARSRILKCRSS